MSGWLAAWMVAWDGMNGLCVSVCMYLWTLILLYYHHLINCSYLLAQRSQLPAPKANIPVVMITASEKTLFVTLAMTVVTHLMKSIAVSDALLKQYLQ